LFLGVSALHLAIIYKNEVLAELLLECKANIHQRAIGTFFLPKKYIDKNKTPSFDGNL